MTYFHSTQHLIYTSLYHLNSTYIEYTPGFRAYINLCKYIFIENQYKVPHTVYDIHTAYK